MSASPNLSRVRLCSVASDCVRLHLVGSCCICVWTRGDWPEKSGSSSDSMWWIMNKAWAFSLRIVEHTLCLEQLNGCLFQPLYTVHLWCTWPAVCTVQLINTWRKAGLSRGFVDYSENGEQIHRSQITDRHTHKGSFRVRPGLKTPNKIQPFINLHIQAMKQILLCICSDYSYFIILYVWV